jgi:hypothetical protein
MDNKTVAIHAVALPVEIGFSDVEAMEESFAAAAAAPVGDIGSNNKSSN